MPRHASTRRLYAQRLLAVVLLATLAWTLPPLMPWLHGPPLAGWPRWAWALFGGWAALVAAVAVLMERGGADAGPEAGIEGGIDGDHDGAGNAIQAEHEGPPR